MDIEMKVNYAKKIKAIRNQSVVDIVYQQLHELILREKIPPGEHINEYQVSERLEVSRASIREACRQLEKEGLVKIKKNQGVFVQEIDVEEAKELYEVRTALEALGIELASERAEKKDFEKLEEVLSNLKKHFQSDDESYFETSLEFHRVITKASKNKSLISLLDIIMNRQKLFRKKFFLIHKELRSSMKQHEDLLDLLMRREGKEAADLMKQHISLGIKRL